MIVYENYAFGFQNLLRIHGSPVYSVLFPTMCSTGFLVLLDYIRDDAISTDERLVQHPYSIGAFIAIFSFLLTFRLNYAYQRYWEGATAVHQMISKWVDTAMLLAAFHYQAESFENYKPPAFGNHPTAVAVDLQRERIQENPSSLEDTLANITLLQDQQQNQIHQRRSWLSPLSMFRKQGRRAQLRRQQQQSSSSNGSGVARVTFDINTKNKVLGRAISEHSSRSRDSSQAKSRIPIPLRFQEKFQGGVAATSSSSYASFGSINLQSDSNANLEVYQMEGSSPDVHDRRALLSKSMSIVQKRSVRLLAPSLFFQELAHLVSLLSGIAMSTLRNDIEGFDAPLKEYIPGKPWPPVDPDSVSDSDIRQYGGDNTFWRAVYFCFGLSRSERNRTLYNASRPFLVLGGVSDREMEHLEAAQGSSAKVALCTLWLKEFISREMMHGSVGKVHHALLSRLYQYISDGCVGYNQARKIAFVPFPFPHGQMTAFFSAIIIFIFPTMFRPFVPDLWLACFLNTLTVMCFLGLHEVARELEDPFQSIPNDLPLTNFQAQINEALVTMYAGYHPDSWWSIVDEDSDHPSDQESLKGDAQSSVSNEPPPLK